MTNVLDAIKDFAQAEPLRFRAIVAGLVAVAAAFGLSVDVEAVLSFLALLGVVTETARRKVSPTKPKRDKWTAKT